MNKIQKGKLSEKKEKITTIITDGITFASMTHLKWRLTDRLLQDEYTVIKHNGVIAAVIFFDFQTKKFLSNTLQVITGGGGAIKKGFSPEKHYAQLIKYTKKEEKNSHKAMITGCVATNEFTYPLLKELGFSHLFSQRKFVKIINVKKMISIGAEKLNKANLPDISLVIRIVPSSEEPFTIRLIHGKFTIEEDTRESDIVISGNVKKLVSLLIGGMRAGIIPLVLTRKIKITIHISCFKKIIHLIRSLR